MGMVKGKQNGTITDDNQIIVFIFSERCIARYKADHASSGGQDIVIATKFLPLPYKLSYPSSLINALRASLARLKVLHRVFSDFIDFFLRPKYKLR
jgi:hypothetical protein